MIKKIKKEHIIEPLIDMCLTFCFYSSKLSFTSYHHFWCKPFTLNTHKENNCMITVTVHIKTLQIHTSRKLDFTVKHRRGSIGYYWI